MRKYIVVILSLLVSTSVFADDFVTKFMGSYVEDKRPVSNVNIGKTMLEKMAENTEDKELKKTFEELNSIRIITTEDKRDSKHYFKKANELAKNEFSDFEEVVSVNERNSKVHVLLKKLEDGLQDLILIALDDNSKLTIITVSGNIDFSSFSKLSESLNKPLPEEEGEKQEQQIQQQTK